MAKYPVSEICAKADREHPTEAERVVWEALKGKGWRRQIVISPLLIVPFKKGKTIILINHDRRHPLGTPVMAMELRQLGFTVHLLDREEVDWKIYKLVKELH